MKSKRLIDIDWYKYNSSSVYEKLTYPKSITKQNNHKLECTNKNII